MDMIKSYRVCVYVPEGALEGFIKAVSPEIPAFLGHYDHVCWWSEKGVEQFRRVGAETIERVSCYQFEFSMPHDKEQLKTMIEEMIIPHHPWEEPVIVIVEQNIVSHAGAVG